MRLADLKSAERRMLSRPLTASGLRTFPQSLARYLAPSLHVVKPLMPRSLGFMCGSTINMEKSEHERARKAQQRINSRRTCGRGIGRMVGRFISTVFVYRRDPVRNLDLWRRDPNDSAAKVTLQNLLADFASHIGRRNKIPLVRGGRSLRTFFVSFI
jgi:hypothetical protein